MFHRTFWTKHRLTGMIVLLGAILFWIGAVMPLTDPKGNFIWYLPPREWLLVIFAHPVLWQWTNLLFLGGSVVTVLGLVLLTTILWAAGDHALAPLGLSAFFFGTGLWVIQLVFRLSVDLWAAQETARTGVVPTVYEPLNLWIRSLFVIYSVLAQSGIGAYGAALLATRVLPQWLGWTSIVFSLAGLSLLAFTGDAPPLMYYLMPMLMGILLLLRRSQVPGGSLREETPITGTLTAMSERRIS